MSNWEKAQYIVEQLNLKGAGLGNASWAIVSKALDDLEAAQQSFAPDAPPESCEHGNLRGKCPVEICSYSKHGGRR